MQPQVKLENVVAAAVKVETRVVPSRASSLPVNDNLLELPPAKATLTKFPPGALVLYKNNASMDTEIKRGVVESVSIDLTPENSSRDYFYTVSFETEQEPIIAGETQLQWASSTPVWAKPIINNPELEWKSATVVGSYQETCDSEPMYSIMVAGSGALFHGVSGDCIRYKQSEGTIPAIIQPTNTAASVVSPSIRYFSELQPATLRVATDGGAEEQASPPKKIRVAESNPIEEIGSGGDRERLVHDTPLTRAGPTNKAPSPYSSLASHVNDAVATPLAENRMKGAECTFEIKIPKWANQIGRVGEAIIGEGGRNHKRLIHETGASKIKLIQADRYTPLRDRANIQPKVIVTIDHRHMQAAKELIEDMIVRAVPEDHRQLMLYSLAKENNYGASDGPARYQRSPRDGQFVWMVAIETPPCFVKYAGLFLGERGNATKDIIAKTGCYFIQIWKKSNPTYVFVSARDADMANAAARLIKDRIKWAIEEGERRRSTFNYGR